MNVVFPIGREVVVDDQRHLLHINASCLERRVREVWKRGEEIGNVNSKSY